jgi:hypothetical protein
MDGRTDETNLTVALRNFAKAPKNLPVGGADSTGLRHAALAQYFVHGNELGVP